MTKQQVKLIAGLMVVYRVTAAVRRGEEVRADWSQFRHHRSARNLLRLALAETALLAELGALVG